MNPDPAVFRNSGGAGIDRRTPFLKAVGEGFIPSLSLAAAFNPQRFFFFLFGAALFFPF